MQLKLGSLALLAATSSFITAAAAEIPNDVPVSTLLASANRFLAQGNFNEALEYFDVAVARDPQNYLTVFKRGAAYLSLGRNALAVKDFDRVLEIKPDFEGALNQRAKIRAKGGEWAGATADYRAVGTESAAKDIAELEEAQGAAVLAEQAAEKEDWEACVTNAGTAIRIASQTPALRKLRARCRLEKGEAVEAVGDLQHLLILAPQDLAPHVQATALLFYSVGDSERALTQIRKCLHSDPESKPCKKLFRRIKAVNKLLSKIEDMKSKKQFMTASKLLAGKTGAEADEDKGLIEDLRSDIADLKSQGVLNEKVPQELLGSLLEQACELFQESKSRKRAAEYCNQAAEYVPNSSVVYLHKAQTAMDNESYDEAIRILNDAKEHDGNNQRINDLLNEAHNALRRSKQKDYYKVLGVTRDADDRTIKRAYRQLVKTNHPDKAHAQGLSKDDAEKKMASINEAYEVLSTPELRQRFDNGDDPNNPEQQGNPFHGSPFGGHGHGGQHFVFRDGGGFPGGSFQFPMGGFKFQGGF